MLPKIAICATTYRPHKWIALYNSIGANDIEFEFVFVGPNPADYQLPKNFRFIKTDVKPAQCFEIAVRNTNADFIFHVADDFEFKTPHPLDRLYACHKENSIVTTQYMQNNQILPLSIYQFFHKYNCDLIIPINSFIKRDLYNRLGGIDKNFIAIYWEIDLAMRVRSLGGTVIMSDVFVNEEKIGEQGKDLWGNISVKDRAFLESQWITNGKVDLIRNNPVQSFSDRNILKSSQGPRGRWRGNGLIFFERIENNLQSQWSLPGRIFRAICKPHNYLNYAKRMTQYIKKEFLNAG